MNQRQGYLNPIPEPFTELQLSKLRSHLDSQGSNKEKVLFNLVSLGLRPIEVVSARLRFNGGGGSRGCNASKDQLRSCCELFS